MGTRTGMEMAGVPGDAASGQETSGGGGFEVFPSVHVADGRVVHLVGDGHVPEVGRTDPLQVALAFQEQGARWLHLVVAEDDGDSDGGLLQARRIIDAVSMDVQLMCRRGIDDDRALEAALDTGCTRLNLGRSALTDLTWCAAAVARHGARLGVSLPVRTGDLARGLRLAGPGGSDAGGLWDAVAVLDAAGCARYVVTDVGREGTLTGPHTGLFTEVCARSTAGVLAAGGIASLDDLRAVADLAPHGVEGALVGRALYAGAFTLSEALACTGAARERD
ncbi:HisA/HisF-related TIM barrel protein [Streptomyces sp. NPDC098789]|uniref:HisA/HisF-related TIM barrel protein n=1 Tax=Streptomyces sp. NPDC098789 TaxID=3366098 RepID=UPI00381DA6E2